MTRPSKGTCALALTLLAFATTASAQPAPAPQPAPQPQPPPQPQPYPDPAQAPYPQPYPQPAPYPVPPPQNHPAPAPYGAPPPYGYAYAPMPMQAPMVDGPKSTGTAVALSLGATLGLPLLMAAVAGDGNDDFLIAGLIVAGVLGPSAGKIYAGDFLSVSLGVRAAGMAMILVGVNSDSSTDEEISFIVLGTFAVIGGAIGELAGLGGAVRDSNFEHAKRTMSPTVAPVVDARGNASGMQVGLVGNF